MSKGSAFRLSERYCRWCSMILAVWRPEDTDDLHTSPQEIFRDGALLSCVHASLVEGIDRPEILH